MFCVSLTKIPDARCDLIVTRDTDSSPGIRVAISTTKSPFKAPEHDPAGPNSALAGRISQIHSLIREHRPRTRPTAPFWVSDQKNHKRPVSNARSAQSRKSSKGQMQIAPPEITKPTLHSCSTALKRAPINPDSRGASCASDNQLSPYRNRTQTRNACTLGRRALCTEL